ncbi:tetratricopeptide repeat protein [bacterium]|nr:tetratricopeptide repeat protein [bacterium]
MSFWGRIFGLKSNPEYEKGIKYYNEENYELAIEQLEKATDSIGRDDPTYALGMFYAAEAHVHMGTAMYFSGDIDGALKHFEKAVVENPTYPDLYYRMGVIYHRQDRNDKAIEMFERAIKLNSGYFEAVCYLGIVLHDEGKQEEADIQFQKALDLSADRTTPISKFLSEHLASNKTEIPPMSSLKGAIDASLEFNSVLKNGVELFNTGNFIEAAKSFNILKEMHPGYADVRFKLALSYLRGNDYGLARAEFEEALKINPGYSEARFYLGILLFDQKKYLQALPHFKEAVKQNADYADLQSYLGATFLYLGRYEEARDILEKVVSDAPGFSQALYYYGLLLYMMGENSEAIDVLKNGMKTEEKYGANDINLALIQLNEGDLEGAMVTLKSILNAGVKSADVYYFVGEVYLRTESLEEAELYFRKALELNNNYLRAREKLTYLLVRKGKYKEAERFLGKNSEGFADIYKIMGDIQYYQKNFEKAEEYYRKSLEVNSEYTDVLLSLAIVLRNKGESDEAQVFIKRLLEIQPENLAARNLLGEGPLNIEEI